MTVQPRASNGRWARAVASTKSEQMPAGRKPAKVDKLARQHAEAAVKALVEVMKDDSASPAARISAAAALLQWGFGKAGSVNKAKLTEDPSGRKADYVIRLSWGVPAPADEDTAQD